MRSVFLVALLAIVGCSKDQPKPGVATSPPIKPTVAEVQPTKPMPLTVPARKVYEREEFRNLVFGKTKEEIAALIGKADKTDHAVLGNSYVAVWTYAKITQDKFSKNPDESTVLTFGAETDGKPVVSQVMP